MPDSAEPIGHAVGARKHAEHAGHRQCAAFIDADDARMRMRRAHHRRTGLSGKTEIVAELALPGNKPRILVAHHRLADETISGFRIIHFNAEVALWGKVMIEAECSG